ncbi:ATP-binding protein [Streptomyces sp. NPDC007044]|uniref:sensor histidine kinase n=1 Tax=Streptomyces sp. NPDC007044 TaxID=3156911 RepID=UPI0034544A6D
MSESAPVPGPRSESGPDVDPGPDVEPAPDVDPARDTDPAPDVVPAPVPARGQKAPRTRSGFRPREKGRITVQGAFNLVLGGMTLLVLVFAVIGAQLLAHTTSISDHLANRVQPARVEGVRLQTALLDQETGVRGYVLTHSTEFLQPYTEGLADQKTITARLRPLISGNKRASADLLALEEAADRWRTTYALPLIEHAREGLPASADTSLLDSSKRGFDTVRTQFTIQDTHLKEDRQHSQDQLRRVRNERDAVFLAMLACFLVAMVFLALLLRRIVGLPLGRLRDDALRVAGGDFDTGIEPSGPADLRVLAEAVEAMRSGIAGALAEAHGQRGLLAAQAAELTEQAEELRRSNAELEQFAYVASHDLQEPLRKVASFCQLLEKRYRHALDERGVQYIDFAVDGAKRMQILINDLLAFSRVGRAQDDHRPVQLENTLDQALYNLAERLEESGARVERPAVLPDTVGDATLLALVWQNLIGNAIKFRSPDRPPVITVESGTAPDGTLVFSVTDNGIGIQEEFSEKVFVLFQRLHSRNTYEGTGIGLAMCRKIIEHHGGRISVDNEYTGGTRIRFTLPAGAEESPDQAAAPGIEGAEGAPRV